MVNTYMRAKLYKDACGMCACPIEWRGPKEERRPFNTDGSPYFLSCNYVSKERKLAYAAQIEDKKALETTCI